MRFPAGGERDCRRSRRPGHSLRARKRNVEKRDALLMFESVRTFQEAVNVLYDSATAVAFDFGAPGISRPRDTTGAHVLLSDQALTRCPEKPCAAFGAGKALSTFLSDSLGRMRWSRPPYIARTIKVPLPHGGFVRRGGGIVSHETIIPVTCPLVLLPENSRDNLQPAQVGRLADTSQTSPQTRRAAVRHRPMARRGRNIQL